MTEAGTTILVQRWLEVLPLGDSPQGAEARNALIEHSRRRMEALCRKMFFQSLSSAPVDWEDVYQEAAIRLWKSLTDVQPKSVKEFFGLAATQIRRVLIDLCRKYKRQPPMLPPGADENSFSPVTLSRWTEFHEQVEALPDNLKEVVNLLWYEDLTQTEAAAILGVDQSTVKRRWRKAREQLAEYIL